MTSNRRILVKIASYRDPELVKTIASLLAAADAPERVDFAIVNQVGEETKGQLDPFLGDPRFTVVEVDWQQSLGLGWARHMCDGMWSGQEFTLQLDSHMRFLRGWDTRFIADWEQTQDPNAVISCYPAIYQFTDGAEVYASTQPHKIISDKVYESGVPALRGDALVAPLERTLFVAGGLQFGPGRMCREVPNDERIFTGDETVHTIRLFTHGYNVYAPSKVTVYHLYERHKWMSVEYWTANMYAAPALAGRMAMLRAQNMAALHRYLDIDDDADVGTIRTKREFYEFSKDFRLHDLMTGVAAQEPSEA